MTKTEELYNLYPGDGESYINELFNQIHLFSTESNKVTKDLIKRKLEESLEIVNKSIEENKD